MELKFSTNHKIDWNADTPEAIADKKHWFYLLRAMLIDLEQMDGDVLAVQRLLKKYNVYFIKIDDMPRVNLDDPK